MSDRMTIGPLLDEEVAGTTSARLRVAKPAVMVVLAFLFGAGLLGLAGWFIASSAVAGLAVGSTFSFLFPSAGVQALAWARTLGRHGERITTHKATLDPVGSLQTSLFARALALPSSASSPSSRFAPWREIWSWHLVQPRTRPSSAPPRPGRPAADPSTRQAAAWLQAQTSGGLADGSSVAHVLEVAAAARLPVVDPRPLETGDSSDLIPVYLTLAATATGFVAMFLLRDHASGLSLRAWFAYLLTDSLDGDGGVIVDGDEVAGNDRTTERPKGWWGSRNGLAVKRGRAGERAVVRRALRPLRFCC